MYMQKLVYRYSSVDLRDTGRRSNSSPLSTTCLSRLHVHRNKSVAARVRPPFC